jgi:hypothetical protein
VQPGNIILVSWLQSLSLWRQNCCFPPFESSEPKLYFSLLTWLNHKTTGGENNVSHSGLFPLGKYGRKTGFFMATVPVLWRKVLPGLKTDPDFPWSHLWLTKSQEFPSVGCNVPWNLQSGLFPRVLFSRRIPTLSRGVRPRRGGKNGHFSLLLSYLGVGRASSGIFQTWFLIQFYFCVNG